MKLCQNKQKYSICLLALQDFWSGLLTTYFFKFGFWTMLPQEPPRASLLQELCDLGVAGGNPVSQSHLVMSDCYEMCESGWGTNTWALTEGNVSAQPGPSCCASWTGCGCTCVTWTAWSGTSWAVRVHPSTSSSGMWWVSPPGRVLNKRNSRLCFPSSSLVDLTPHCCLLALGWFSFPSSSFMTHRGQALPCYLN